MQTQFVFRHMDSSDALRNYAEERLEKIKRYFSDPLKVSCTFAVEKIHHHAAFDVTLRNGLALHAAEKTEKRHADHSGPLPILSLVTVPLRESCQMSSTRMMA